jgi:hypothetical protein
VLSHASPVALEGHRHVGARQRDRVDDLRDVRRLGRQRAQELPPGGHVVEQLAHLDARARGHADRLEARRAAAVGGRQHPGVGTVRARGDLEATDRRDARQRLAAEPEGRDLQEVFERSDLAGRVSRHGELEVLLGHPGAIVRHDARCDAAPLDRDVDPRRPGVERVLA